MSAHSDQCEGSHTCHDMISLFPSLGMVLQSTKGLLNRQIDARVGEAFPG